MGNNKCKPIDSEFDFVASIVVSVPFASLTQEEKDTVVNKLRYSIISGCESGAGFDVNGLVVHVTPSRTVDPREAIPYAMSRLGVRRPHLIVKNVRDAKHHVVFLQDL